MKFTHLEQEMLQEVSMRNDGKRMPDRWDWILRIAIVASLAGVVYAAWSGKVFQPVFDAVAQNEWTAMIARPSMLWMLMGTMLLAFRTFLWFRYRPLSPADLDNAPALTVIIPAYNEGAMVEKSIASVAAANYPKGRLEIFVVDDGSSDDTWEHISRAAAQYPELVTAVRFPRNQGKRAALAEGFRRAKGEVVVTIDSDSVIESETLLAMAGPFHNPRVGAVAGKVAVFNRRAGLIPRMLHVRYILSFDLLRAVQSTYGTVYCCPGALAGYRTALIRELLDRWLNQRFLGVACTYGEDRSLTNFILSQGYDTVYQRNGVVHTIVPESYKKLCKMFLRWDRSYIREEMRLMRIVWSRPLKARLITLMDIFVTNLRYPVGWASLALLVFLSISDPTTLLRVLLVIGMMSALNMLYYLQSERSWDALFGIVYSYYAAFLLFWIFPYAMVTVRAKSWMTR
jgi:hyaluronan synthase